MSFQIFTKSMLLVFLAIILSFSSIQTAEGNGIQKQTGKDVSKRECGTNPILNESKPGGVHTVEDRIKDCSNLPNSTRKTKAGVEWNLVARTEKKYSGHPSNFYEVWRDSKSDLLWGDQLPKGYKFIEAITACDSELGEFVNAGITDKKFGLPASYEFEEAVKNGLLEVIPLPKYDYGSMGASECRIEYWTKDGSFSGEGKEFGGTCTLTNKYAACPFELDYCRESSVKNQENVRCVSRPHVKQ